MAEHTPITVKISVTVSMSESIQIEICENISNPPHQCFTIHFIYQGRYIT